MIKVKKGGEIIEQKINHEQNEGKVQVINNIINKNKAMDILKELKDKNDGKNVENIDHTDVVQKKFK